MWSIFPETMRLVLVGIPDGLLGDKPCAVCGQKTRLSCIREEWRKEGVGAAQQRVHTKDRISCLREAPLGKNVGPENLLSGNKVQEDSRPQGGRTQGEGGNMGGEGLWRPFFSTNGSTGSRLGMCPNPPSCLARSLKVGSQRSRDHLQLQSPLRAASTRGGVQRRVRATWEHPFQAHTHTHTHTPPRRDLSTQIELQKNATHTHTLTTAMTALDWHWRGSVLVKPTIPVIGRRHPGFTQGLTPTRTHAFHLLVHLCTQLLLLPLYTPPPPNNNNNLHSQGGQVGRRGT